MTAYDLAIKYLQGDLTETQLTYWLHINAIPEDEFNKEVQKPVPNQQVLKDLELKIEITKITIAEGQVGIMENE